MLNNKKAAAIFAAAFANVFFGFSNFFSVIALRYSEPMIILSIRFTIAFLILSLMWALRIVRLDFKGKKKGGLILMCLAQPFVYFICELYGISLTSSVLSGVMLSLIPVAAVVLSALFLKESARPVQLIFLIVSLAGVILINMFSSNKSDSTVIGIILLFGAVFSAAAFNLLSRSISAVYSPFERTYVMFAVAAVGFNAVTASMYKSQYLSLVISAVSHIEFIGAVFYLSVCSSIIAYLLYNFATTNLNLVMVTSFSNIIPLVTIFAGVFILNEEFTPVQFFCSLLIITGVWGVNRFGLKRAKA